MQVQAQWIYISETKWTGYHWKAMKTVYWKKTGSMAVLIGMLLGTVVIYQEAISTQRSSPTPNMKEKVENGTKFILYYTPFLVPVTGILVSAEIHS